MGKAPFFIALVLALLGPSGARLSMAVPPAPSLRDSLQALAQNRQRTQEAAQNQVRLQQSRAIQQTSPDDALRLARQALQDAIARQDKTQEAKARLRLGQLFIDQNKLKLADDNLNLALPILDRQGEASDRFQVLLAKGDLKYRQGDYTQALAFHYKAQEAAEKAGLKQELGLSQLAIGTDLSRLDDYTQCVLYLERALDQLQQVNDTLGIAGSLRQLGDAHAAHSLPLKAIESYQRAIPIYKAAGRLADQVGCMQKVARVLGGQKDFYNANSILIQAIKLADQNGLNEYKPALYLQLGKNYADNSEPEKASFYTRAALGMANRLNQPETSMEAYRVLSEAYTGMADYEKALRHYKMYVSLKERRLSEQKARQEAEMRIRYNTEKIGKEIAVLTREKKIQELEITRKQNLIYTVLAALAFMLLLAVLLHRKNLFEQTLNDQLQHKNDQLGQAKQEIEDQRDQLDLRTRELDEAMARMRSSISYAKRIQDAILPDEGPICKFFTDHFVLFRPKDIVSGDFYWWAESGGKIIVAVADCTGHGVPGAFMSLIGHSLLNSIVKDRRIHEPHEILTELHEGIVISLQQSAGSNREGLDIGVCVYDPFAQEICFAGARSNLWFVSKNGEMEILEGDRASIGGFRGGIELNRHYTTKTAWIKGPGMIYMATDGYADQFDETSGQKFSWPRFRTLLREIAFLPADIQLETAAGVLNDWRGTAEQTDDVLLVGLRIGQDGSAAKARIGETAPAQAVPVMA